MFGVLVVEDEQGQLGYLAAYSGLLSERNDWPYFVPPVYDLLKPNGYFQVHEAEITQLNKQILELEKNPVRLQLLQSLDALKKEQERELDVFRRQKQKAKRIRDEHRQSGVLSAEEEANLIHESQFMKAELRRMKKRMEVQRAEIEQKLEVYNNRISELKRARKQLSDALQQSISPKCPCPTDERRTVAHLRSIVAVAKKRRTNDSISLEPTTCRLAY